MAHGVGKGHSYPTIAAALARANELTKCLVTVRVFGRFSTLFAFPLSTAVGKGIGIIAFNRVLVSKILKSASPMLSI